MIVPGVMLVVLLAVLVFWYMSANVYERALHAAKDLCRREGWQLLDDSVSLKKISLGRGADGRIHVRRYYQFGYAQHQGERREKTVVMLGGDPIYQAEASGNVIQFPTTKR